MGHRIGIDRLEAFGRASGFGDPTGIDLPHEKGGLMPGKKWKRRRIKERWQGGDTLNTSIGQGYTLVSPLQLGRFVSSLINGGRLLKPLLLSNIPPVVQSRLPADAGQIKRILDSMQSTVEHDRGTARRLRRDDATMGGKTGTAQVVRLKKEDRGKDTAEIPYEYRDHSWIAAWGVKDGRAVVIVVLVEHGGSGGEAAVPVAKTLFDHLFGPAGTADLLADWPHVRGLDPDPYADAGPAPDPEGGA